MPNELFKVCLPMSRPKRRFVTLLSFVFPILLWCAVSYLPFFWHPMVKIEQPGDVGYFKQGMLVERELFNKEYAGVESAGGAVPSGARANPIYLPAPHEVVTALYTSFTTEPQRRSEKVVA